MDIGKFIVWIGVWEVDGFVILQALTMHNNITVIVLWVLHLQDKTAPPTQGLNSV